MKNQLRYTLLGIIAEETLKSKYIAEWHICAIIGVKGGQFGGGTPEDDALRSLIADGLVENMPNLSYRYRLKLPQP